MSESQRRRGLRVSARPSPPKTSGSGAFVPLAALTAVPPVATGAKPDPKDGPPCHLCTARCCKYFALAIDTPVTPQDHDYIRWFLMHEHVVVWVQDGDWYLEVRTHCRHLQADNGCGVYETRPQICRDYGLPDEADDPEQPCEFFGEDAGYDLFFGGPEEFDVWSRRQLVKRDARLAKRREAYRRKAAEAGRREAIA